MRIPSWLACACLVAALAACTPQASPPPQQADAPPPPAPLQEPLKAIDKANAVEERVMEQKEAQDRAMEAQEGG